MTPHISIPPSISLDIRFGALQIVEYADTEPRAVIVAPITLEDARRGRDLFQQYLSLFPQSELFTA